MAINEEPVNGSKRPYPPAPADIDWSALSIQNIPTVNGHVECQFNAATQCWTTPRMITEPYLRVHGLCPGLNYGQQVYEGLKAFRTINDTIHVFRPAAHAQRLRHSAGLVCLPQVPDSLFYECVRLVVASNAEFVPPATSQGFLYIRPILFGSGPQMALAPPNEFTLAMYVGPSLPYHGNMAIDALVLDDFDRAAPRGTGSGKVGGNYSPVWPHQMKAKSQGFAVTLHLDSDTRTFVEEFSTSGFIGIDKTRTLYIPDAPNAINSITSDSLATISESMQIKVKREKIPFSSIGRFSEVLAVGTAANAVPIRSITRIATNEKYQFEHHASKETSSAIVERLSNIQRGLDSDVFGWNWTVEGF